METIVVDIETGIHEERFDRFSTEYGKPRPKITEFDPDGVKLGAMKDPDKIAAKVAECREKHEEAEKQAIRDWERDSLDHVQKQLDKAALYPGLSEVVAIGWQVPHCAPVTLIIGDDGIAQERDLLAAFLKFFHKSVEASRNTGMPVKFGFWSGNSRRDGYFDYLHLKEACRRHGMNPGGEFIVPPSDRGSRWVDLTQDYLSAGAILPKQDSYPAYLSLNDAVDYTDGFGATCDKLTAVNGLVDWIVRSKDDMDVEGATFAEWVRSGNREQFELAREYLVNDLAMTRWVAAKQVGLL